MNTNLDDLRAQIVDIDNQLIGLLVRRAAISKEIGLYKKEHNIPVLQNDVFQRNLSRLIDLSDGSLLTKEAITQIFHAIHKHSLSVQEDL